MLAVFGAELQGCVLLIGRGVLAAAPKNPRRRRCASSTTKIWMGNVGVETGPSPRDPRELMQGVLNVCRRPAAKHQLGGTQTSTTWLWTSTVRVGCLSHPLLDVSVHAFRILLCAHALLATRPSIGLFSLLPSFVLQTTMCVIQAGFERLGEWVSLARRPVEGQLEVVPAVVARGGCLPASLEAKVWARNRNRNSQGRPSCAESVSYKRCEAALAVPMLRGRCGIMRTPNTPKP